MKRRDLLGRTLLACTGIAGWHHEASAAQRVLRLATTGAPEGATGRGAQAVASAAGQLSGGALRVETYFYGSAGGESQLTEALALGSVDLAILNVSAFASITPLIGMFDVMFLMRDARHGRAVMDGPLGQEAMTWLEAKGVQGLAWGENGMRHLTAGRPIRTPEEMQGLRIRIPSSEAMQGGFTALGAKPLAVPFPDLYAKLAAGQVEAQENPISVTASSRFQEVQKVVSMTGHAYSACLIALSAKTAERLTAAEYEWLLQAARQAARITRDEADAAERSGLEKLRQGGMKVVSDVQREAFVKAISSFNDQIAGRFGRDRLHTIQNTVA